MTFLSTRSRLGARPLFGWLLALSLAPSAALAAHPRGDKGPGPFPWRIGHEVGFTADVAAFPESSGTELDVYLRIRPSLIAELCRNGREPTPIRIEAHLRSVFGGRTDEREQIFSVIPADTAHAIGEVVVLSFPARPGPHHLEIRLDSRRRELARRGIQGPETARVEGEFDIPGPQAGREISDIQFVWMDAGDSHSHVFGRSGRALVPNPERLYGLYATDLSAYFEARGVAGDERPWHWVARLADSTGRVIADRDSTAPGASAMSAAFKLDVSGLPAGGYDLEVKAWQEGDPGALLRKAHFSVAWQPETWRRDPMDMLDEAHFLLATKEEDRFERLQAGEQERIFDDYWKIRDPTPETGVNEARIRFLRRVDFANRTYGRYGLGRGMFSDMGRVFIRYGEPDEVLRQVIPGFDDNLKTLVQQLAATEKRAMGNTEDGEPGADMRPFEVWIYEGQIPLPIDADPRQDIQRLQGRQRLVFLFVDENWLGDYHLLYSSE